MKKKSLHNINPFVKSRYKKICRMYLKEDIRDLTTVIFKEREGGNRGRTFFPCFVYHLSHLPRVVATII